MIMKYQNDYNYLCDNHEDISGDYSLPATFFGTHWKTLLDFARKDLRYIILMIHYCVAQSN